MLLLMFVERELETVVKMCHGQTLHCIALDADKVGNGSNDGDGDIVPC